MFYFFKTVDNFIISNYAIRFSRLFSSEKSLYTISNFLSHTIEVKKSKFITSIIPVNNFQIAMQELENRKDLKASHNCWAFISKESERYSDDGEPTGTAGKPILQAIKNENIVDCLVIVTRYFGGIKLGTGGLSRAYAQAAKDTLTLCDKVKMISMVPYRLVVPLDEIGQVYHIITSPQFRILRECNSKEIYTTLAVDNFVSNKLKTHNTKVIDVVQIDISIPESLQTNVLSVISDACRGRVIIQQL